jgi:hypothetical protein
MDAPSFIREPCGTRNCAEESLESLVRPVTRGPRRSSTVTATPWRSRILSGLRPLPPPPQPRQS